MTWGDVFLFQIHCSQALFFKSVLYLVWKSDNQFNDPPLLFYCSVFFIKIFMLEYTIQIWVWLGYDKLFYIEIFFLSSLKLR